MFSPQVSVVTPCFNAEKYVGEAIESALAQTYPNIEVIVIDDGSTDGSLDVIRSFGERIRWETGPNRGGCAARNRGISLAAGEFIQFLDADDLLHPTKLERQMTRFDEGIDLILCDGDLISAITGKPTGSFARAFANDAVRFVLEGVLPIQAPMHRAKTLRALGGFREDLQASQEFDLHLRLACSGAVFVHLPERLFTVRRVQNSVSCNYVLAVEPQLKLCREAYEHLQQSGGLTEARARAFASLMARNARGCMQRGAREVAEAFLAEARRMHSSGGIEAAFDPMARALYQLAGIEWTEKLVAFKRRLFSKRKLT